MTHSNILDCIRFSKFDAFCFGHIEFITELLANFLVLLNLGIEDECFDEEITPNVLLRVLYEKWPRIQRIRLANFYNTELFLTQSAKKAVQEIQDIIRNTTAWS